MKRSFLILTSGDERIAIPTESVVTIDAVPHDAERAFSDADLGFVARDHSMRDITLLTGTTTIQIHTSASIHLRDCVEGSVLPLPSPFFSLTPYSGVVLEDDRSCALVLDPPRLFRLRASPQAPPPFSPAES